MLQAKDVKSFLSKISSLIDKEIERYIPKEPSKFYNMMRYHFGFVNEKFETTKQYSGKKIRPALCILSYASISDTYTLALPVATSIEMLHNFTLIHDDIEDRDILRRNRYTVWYLFGEEHAINVGDSLHVLAYKPILKLRDEGVREEKILEILDILTDALIKICEGQFLDLEFQNREIISLEEYFDMIERKTATLIEASCKTGACLATDDESLVNKFSTFGKNIGISFQIIDDVIGIWSEKTGKPKGSDIINRKKTLPIIMGIENDSRILEIFKKNKIDENDVEIVIKILDEYNIKEKCIEIAKDYIAKAEDSLKSTGIKNYYIDMLLKISKFIIERNY